MSDFDRPVHDPTTDPGPDTDTTAMPVPAEPLANVPPTGDTGTFGAPVTAPVPPASVPDPGPSGPEPADVAAPAAPVGMAAGSGANRSRTRWIAAAGIIALIVGLTAIATLALTGSAPPSTVAGYVPTDSLMYGEVRLDLPGDQRQKVGQFLSKFPGFADQAALETKLDETLDRLTSESSDGKHTYTRDIKPWFDGQMAFSMGSVPTGGDPAPTAADVRALLLLAIKDEALARAWFDGVIADSGAAATTEDHQGVSITVFTEPDRDHQVGFAIVGGKVAIAGDLASVRAAIDTNGQSGLATSPTFTAAQAALTGDHVGFALVDVRAFLDAAVGMAGSSGATPPIGDELLALVPDWAAVRLRIDGDAVVMDTVTPHVADAPGPDSNRPNTVARYAPAATILLAAGNDYGATILEGIDLYRADPTMADALRDIEQAAGILGGLDSALGWMGDSGVVVARSGDGVEGGLVIVPADAAGGRQLLTTLRSFIQLGGAQAGVTVRDEDHNGTTITIVDLGTASDLAGLAGALGGMSLPTDPGTLPDGRVELSYAATDEVVVIGASPDFVRHALDAGGGDALAGDARYQDLVGRAGAEHTGVTFVDIAAIRGLVETMLVEASGTDRAEYEESVKPFLTPFDALIAVNAIGADLDQSHVLITVK